MKIIRSYEKVINWIHARLNNRQFLIFSSILVGITAGLAAVVLKTFVHYIHLAITHDYHIQYQYYLYLVFPIIGIIITVYLTRHLLQGRLGRGTANILYSIIKKSAVLPKDAMYSHIITSGITVGFGGSAGLESPIVTTGASIGSNYSQTYHLNYKERVLLLACGAAAGIAGAFNAPITGVLFALEVLLVDVSISAFIPLIIAGAAGALCSKIILHEGILLSFHLQEPFDYINVPFYILLGIFCGLMSVYYARSYEKIEQLFLKNRTRAYKKVIVGGTVLGLLILCFPTLFGEGYTSIKALADMKPQEIISNSIFSDFITNDWLILLFIGLILFTKVVAASITINSGGNGGNFAPSLFVGAYLGYFFSRLVNMLGITKLPESNFTLVAMSGILTGIFHAPLTGIFLIAEITGGYDLMIPLMIVSAFSYTVVKYFEPLSMDAKKLAKKGRIYTHDKDKTILSSLRTSKIVETNFQKVEPDTTLGSFVELIARSKRNIFPVVDKDNIFLGIILLDNVRDVMFNREMYDKILARQLMRKPPAVVSMDEDVHSVMKKFDETGAWNLPVVDNGQYEGFVSKSTLLTKYRNQLIEHSSY